MERSALKKLMETADLIGMVEDLMKPGTIEKISPATFSGIRLTLSSVRENILQSHDKLASDIITRARDLPAATEKKEEASNAVPPQFSRSNLQSSLEKVIES